MPDAAAVDDWLGLVTHEDMGMVRCEDCRFLTVKDRLCGVAEKRRERHRQDPEAVKGDFPRWRYAPALNLWRRCGYFQRA